MALRTVLLEDGAPADVYPFGLPAVRALPLHLASGVTVLVGENGSGKSTLVEALAVAAPERFLRHLGGSDDGGDG
jgi:predicted ATPase